MVGGEGVSGMGVHWRTEDGWEGEESVDGVRWE